MKKLFLLFLTVSVFSGCSKDDSNSNQNGENCRLMEWKSFYDEGDGLYDAGTKKIFYDNQNRISKVETYYSGKLEFTTTFSYSDKQIIANSNGDKTVYNLNGKNLIESYTEDGYKTTITYNSSNQLSTVVDNGQTTILEYSDGNLTSAKKSLKNSPYSSTWKLTYDISKYFSPMGTFGLSPFYELFGDTEYDSSHILYEQGYFGTKIKNAVSTLVDGNITRKYNYSYSNGKLTSYGRQDEKFELKYSCN